jgi:hypothetical protein
MQHDRAQPAAWRERAARFTPSHFARRRANEWADIADRSHIHPFGPPQQ